MKHHLMVPVAVAVLALSLTACGGDDTATDAAAETSSGSGQSGQPGSAPSGAPEGEAPGGMGFPGANGEVAAVQGDVVQVQGMQGQVAVTLTGSTTITTQVAGSLDDVEVGSCVVVVGAASDDSEDDSEDDSGPATSVRISDPVDGDCAGGFAGGPGGERPSGAPSEMPTDMPSDMPSDLPDGAGGPGSRGGLVVGEVTAVDDAGFTVGEETVEVDDSTTFTASVDGTASDVKVGRCVSAQGETDDTGAVTADTVSVSEKVDGECSAGFGRGGFGGMPGGDASGDEAAS